MQYYPLHSNLDESSKLLSKKEFTDKDTKLYHEPHQIFLRNYISKQTIYDSVLIYHSMGSGKTCSAISIAEGFKEYIHNLNRNIVVLVKNKNIERNFKAELLSQCTDNNYLTDEERDILNSKVYTDSKKSIKNKVARDINKYYQFITYGTFVNRVLGSKEYEKDEFGNNTNVIVRKNGQIVRKLSKDRITDLSNSVIIVDEAHNITNTDTYHALYKILKNSSNTRLVLLTATPIFDNIKEIFELTNLLNINANLPIRNELFRTDPVYVEKIKSTYINENVLKGGISSITDYGLEQIKKSLQGKISHAKTNLQTFPTRIDIGESITDRPGSVKVIFCNMSKYQYDIYTQAFKDDTGIEDTKTPLETIDIDYDKDPEYDYDELNVQNMETIEKLQKTSSLYKNSSDASTMVYPDNLYGKLGYQSFFTKQQGRLKPKDPTVLHVDGNLKMYSSKLHTLITNVKKSEGLVFIFSHFVTNGGTSLLSRVLSANGFSEYRGGSSFTNNSFVVFDDKMSGEQKEKIRKIFNSPENANGSIIRIIVGSPVMSEGITLKRVRQVHILEPYWNLSRIEQVIGRAIRNYSHFDLPKHQQNVEIFKYVSIYKPEEQNEENSISIDFFIDKEKYILSEEKDRSNKKVERFLKKLAIDCEFNKDRNQLDESNNMTSQCDYLECKYECDIPKLNIDDRSTYNYYLQTLANYQIASSTDLISKAFMSQLVWSLQDIIPFIRKNYPYISEESIYTSLTSMVNDKLIIKDTFGRDGFIIQKGPYYIFNAENIDVKSSFFSKFLDFSTYYSKTNLNNYIFDKYKINILEEKATEPELKKSIDMIEKEKDFPEEIILSKQLLLYNENVANNNIVYGTFYSRPQKENEVTIKDKKFRIVDKRDSLDSDDKRKIVTGMVCTSYSKGELIKLVEFLQIEHSENLKKLDKTKLCQLIEDHFDKNNMLLK